MAPLDSDQQKFEVPTGDNVQGTGVVLHGDNNPREEYGSIAVSLLIVLHNGFYAFAFEFLVVTTCKLALYIIFSATIHFFLDNFLLTQASSSTSSASIFGHPCT